MPLQTDNAGDFCIKTLHHSEPFTNAEAFDGWDLEYTQLSAGKYGCESKELRMRSIQIYTERFNVTSNQRGTAWDNSYVFAFPTQMDQDGRINGRNWGREILAFRGENEYDALVPPMNLLVIAVSREILADYLWAFERKTAESWLRRDVLLIPDQERLVSTVQAFTVMLENCCTNSNLLADSNYRFMLEETTMEMLAPLILNNLAPAPFAYKAFNHTQIVNRARQFLFENIDEPLQIIDVCNALGISRRVLQYSFQDVLDINPVAYLRLLRLNGARRDLIHAREKSSQVKDVVTRWGFWHLSRFSSEYKKMFNELPSETLRQATRLTRVFERGQGTPVFRPESQ